MSIRLIISITATPGNGDMLALEIRSRCPEVRQEPGCEQYEIFQSVDASDRLVLLEKWESPESLDAHAERMRARPSIDRGLVEGVSQREDYEYNRTR